MYQDDARMENSHVIFLSRVRDYLEDKVGCVIIAIFVFAIEINCMQSDFL